MAASKSTPNGQLVISDLITSRLHTLTALLATSNGMRVERRHGLTLLEWRSIAQLGGFAPLSLKDLARGAGLDKSYASRTVAGLTDRGLVVSERNGADARGVTLRLSDKGLSLYRDVFAESINRNERLLTSLSPQQREQLMDMVKILTVNARTILEEERKIASGELPDEEISVESSQAKAMSPSHKDVDIAKLRYLIAQAQSLLN